MGWEMLFLLLSFTPIVVYGKASNQKVPMAPKESDKSQSCFFFFLSALLLSISRCHERTHVRGPGSRLCFEAANVCVAQHEKADGFLG